MVKDLGIYVHIPFCISKCIYCDFYSKSTDEDTHKKYMTVLKEHIMGQSAQHRDKYRVVSVFFGGGTPSVIDAGMLMDILNTIRECYDVAEDCEVTVECNPGTVSYNKLCTYYANGVNRLSIGLQSVNDEELKALGRIHTFADFCKTYEDARKAGFDNINVDVISAIPGQGPEQWKKTLRTVTGFKTEHISAYSLIVEENTPLYNMIGRGVNMDLPDEDTEREMYYLTGEILERAGYEQYEISNYARNGYQCRHNKLYWQRTDYMGYGAGASSLINNVRFSYKKDLEAYIDNPSQCLTEKEVLSTKDAMSEFMYLGLRMITGVKRSDFYRSFGRKIDNVFGDAIDKYVRMGYMIDNGDAIRLSNRGIDVSNYIFADFLL